MPTLGCVFRLRRFFCKVKLRENYLITNLFTTFFKCQAKASLIVQRGCLPYETCSSGLIQETNHFAKRKKCHLIDKIFLFLEVLKKGLQFIYFSYFVSLFAVLILISFPLTMLFLLLPKKIRDYAMFSMMKAGSHILLVGSGIIPRNLFRKRTDFSKSYIIIPTHKSYIEAASLYTSIPFLFKTLGKKELEKVPLYGLIFKTVCISVDRSSLSARALSFRKIKNELGEGMSVTIFPEGTFEDQPHHQLLPFQDGCFTLAIMEQTDLLPVIYPDSCARMHPSKFTQITPGMNRAVFLPPVSVQGFQKKDLPHLKRYTQHFMQSCFDHLVSSGAGSVYDFALNYQKNNPILPH